MSSNVYTAEKILKKRVRNGITQYYIKWKGYSNRDNTWEPQENILDTSLLVSFEKGKKKKKPTPRSSNQIQHVSEQRQNEHEEQEQLHSKDHRPDEAHDDDKEQDQQQQILSEEEDNDKTNISLKNERDSTETSESTDVGTTEVQIQATQIQPEPILPSTQQSLTLNPLSSQCIPLQQTQEILPEKSPLPPKDAGQSKQNDIREKKHLQILDKQLSHQAVQTLEPLTCRYNRSILNTVVTDVTVNNLTITICELPEESTKKTKKLTKST